MSGGFNNPVFNGIPFNGVVSVAPPPPPIVRPHRSPPDRHYSDRYTLEVQDTDQKITAFLRDASEIRWTQAINSPSVLTFQYPASKEQAQEITFPNLVILRDEDGDILDSFLIAQVSKRREDSGEQVFAVHCEGYLSLLGKCIIEEQEFESATVGAIVQTLLGTQPTDSPWMAIEMGSIEAGLRQRRVTHTFENVSVLQALRDLRGLVGGYYRVRENASGEPRFHWDILRASEYARRHITAGKNSPWLTAVEDYRTIRTKVIARGAGNLTSTKISDAAKLAEYGTLTFTATHPMITDQGTLDEYAEMVLAEREQPRVQYYIGAIDLGKAETSWDYADEDLNLGDTVYIYDSHLDVQIGTAITGIRRDLQGGVSLDVVDPDAGDAAKGWSTRRNKPVDLLDEIIALKEQLDNLKFPEFNPEDFEFDFDLEEIDMDALIDRILSEIDWEKPEYDFDGLADRILDSIEWPEYVVPIIDAIGNHYTTPQYVHDYVDTAIDSALGDIPPGSGVWLPWDEPEVPE